MKLRRNHFALIAVAIVAVLVFFPQSRRYVGGISPTSPKGAGGADAASALPRGYRSDPPNSPYTAFNQ